MKFAEPLLASLLKQRERWILWTPVALALGVGGYFSLRFEPPLWSGFLALVLLTALIAPFYKNKLAVLLWLPFCLIALGFTAASLRTWTVSAPVLERKTYPLLLQGRVAAVDALPEQTYRIVLDRLRYDTEKLLPQNPMPERLRIKLKKGNAPPAAGDVVRLKAMLLPLSPPVLPGAYDFQRHAFFDGIGATGFAISDADIIFPGDRGFFFESLRRYLRTHIRAGIENSDAAAITIALLDGEDQDISKETYSAIRTAGIAHLIAISGLQVTLVTGFFFFLVRALLASVPYIALRWPVKKITAFIAMCGAIFYMLLIGSSISAERSVIMVCVVMTAIMLDRDPFTLRLAAFAAAAVLLFQPESLFGASFQLSFAAVVALIAFYESTRDWWSLGHEDRGWFAKAGLYILGSLATTLVATLATAALGLYHFLRTPLFPGLVANLIAVPLSSFVTMPAAITASFLMPLGLEKIPLKVAEWSVVVIIRTAETVSQWPYVVYHADAWQMWILVMMCFGGLWICLWRDKMRWLGVLPVLAGIILIPLTPRADILASEGGKIFAVRDDKGVLWISSDRAEKFVRESWIEREAEAGHGFWTEEDSPVSCDDEACLYRHKNRLVSFVKKYTALEQDCAAADIIISDLYIQRKICGKPGLLLDRRELKDKGAHALYLNDDGNTTLRTVYDERGKRPWTAQKKSSAPYRRHSPPETEFNTSGTGSAAGPESAPGQE
ncbi:MAG: ComEC family competence protein [Alphaproteobacteria bacterium]|nr:ComEC family competence protein [Alphaproteobacteria bacterium]